MPQWAGPVAQSESGTVQISVQDDRVTVTANSVGCLRSLATVASADASQRARELELRVTDWERPWRTWSGRVGHLPGLVRHEVILPERERGPAIVTLTLAEPVPLRSTVAAVLPALEPHRALPAPISPDLASLGGAPSWLAPEQSTVDVTGGDSSDAEVRPYDTRLSASTTVSTSKKPSRGYGQDLLTSPYGLVAAGGQEWIAVDATAANPRGRQDSGPDLPAGRLSLVRAADGVWWQIRQATNAEAVVVAGRAGDPLDGRQTAALVQLGVVSNADPLSPDPSVEVPPVAQAAAVAQLAMTGVVLHLVLPQAVADLLAPQLVATVSAPPPDARADALEWEMRSVAQRRDALRHHATAFVLPRAVAGAYPSLSRPPAVTALLVSRRPGHLADAVAAMVAQRYPELEIVVGLHGCDLPPASRDRLTDHGVPVHIVDIPAELSFGEALGEATRWARGSLITKIDDDDRYGPEHVWDLVLARHYSGATVVGKGAEFVFLEARNLTVRRWMGREHYTDVVAGGSMLLSRGDLEAVGGWRPLDRSVDRGLLDRVLGAGGLVYRTHGLGFVYTRHGDGHTWDAGIDYFLRNPRRQWSGLPPFDEFGAR